LHSAAGFQCLYGHILLLHMNVTIHFHASSHLDTMSVAVFGLLSTAL